MQRLRNEMGDWISDKICLKDMVYDFLNKLSKVEGVADMSGMSSGIFEIVY